MEYDNNHVYGKQTVMKIDTAAIAHNIQVLHKITKGTIIAVIKENGYGMGLFDEYTLLKEQGIDFYAVTNSNEAIQLREFGCTEPILLMSPCENLEEALALHQADITLMLGSIKQARLLKDVFTQTGTKPHVHLAFETGMGRYGFLWNQLPDLTSLPNFVYIDGCYTHLHGKPAHYAKEVMKQVERFKQAVSSLEKQGIPSGMKHISNSAATMSLGDLGMDAVRTGSAIIGKAAQGNGKLNCAVWMEAPICQVMELPKGSTIGYQACAQLKRDSRLGLIRAGHGDGLFLGYADTPEPFIRGIIHLLALKLLPKRYLRTVTIQKKKVPVIGRSGIAHFVVDLTDTSFQEGDIVRIEVNPLFVHPSVPKEFISVD